MGVLVAKGLVKAYGEQRALDGVDLDIAPGSFVSIMGPSGSGKSTLLHLLGALDTPTAGDVLFDGRSLADHDDAARTLLRRHHIGFVFQAYNLVPVLTAAENVSLPAVIAGESAERYAERLDQLLEAVGLREHRDKFPAELSGGQAQRVALARALINQPSVLLADEPTGNLDSRAGRDLLATIKREQGERGHAVVLVTHDANAAAVADEVLLLRDGRFGGRLLLDGEGGDRAQLVLAWLQELEA